MRSIHFQQRMRDWAPSWDERVKLEKGSIRSTEIFCNKISELCKGAKPLQYHPNFMNKIGEGSNIAH